MLAGTAGFAAAEMTLSGSAVMGVGDKGGNDVTSIMETYITFTGSGETDGGLSFGLSATLGQYAPLDGGYVDDGTSVFVSGAFGKISMGDVAEADEVATLSDIGGLTGLGVDNVAEAFTGDSITDALVDAATAALVLTPAEVTALEAAIGNSHDVNYTYSAGDFTVSVSGRLTGDNDSYAVGGKYSFGEAYIGLGYTNTDFAGAVAAVNAVTPATLTSLETETTSVYGGGTFGGVAVKAMYSDFQADWVDGTPAAASIDGKSYGLTVDYTMDALTLSAAYSKGELDGVDFKAYGVGASYDLGGGATFAGGIARNAAEDTVWEAGVALSF